MGALVVLAAFVMFLIGIAGFIVGLAGLIPGSPIPGTTLLLNGLLYVIIGIVLGVAGFGLLRLRPWAWGLALLATLVTLVYLGYNVWQDSNAGKDRSPHGKEEQDGNASGAERRAQITPTGLCHSSTTHSSPRGERPVAIKTLLRSRHGKERARLTA